MPTLSLRLQTLEPDDPWWPDDDRLGEGLVGLVRRNLARGAPTTAVVVRRHKLVLMPMHPFADAGIALPMVLAGLARWTEGGDPPEAIGLIGRVLQRRGGRGPAVPVALVFLEWPDGRWWRWRQVLDADGEPVEDGVELARAVDGLARPAGIGGYWTLARTRKPRIELRPRVPDVRGDAVN